MRQAPVMPFDPDQPYNDLPDLPPAADLETRVVLKACIEARSALAALKQACDLIPNPAMLINTLPLLEAKDSSEIENIVTTTDKLFAYSPLDADKADPQTREALRYGTALWEGCRSLAHRPLCTTTAVEVCSRIKGNQMDIRRIPGTDLKNPATGEVVYTPPVGEALLRQKLASWENYLHNEIDTDPLVRMAVAHYQFEAIHPFTDGNGRTGRVLNLLYLVECGLLSQPVLYLSRYIINHKPDYYRLLREVTEAGQWEPWLLYLLTGIGETANWTREKIAAIRELFSTTADHIREMAPKIYSHELVEVIFNQPYCRIPHLEAAGIAKRETASRYLQQLVTLGILEEQKTGRDKLFVQPKLMQLLTTDSNRTTPYN